jgi:DNA-binding NarL/FixJ family response regulator
MDIRIRGDMDGVQTAEQLRRGADAPPVVFLTSHHDDRTVARAAQAAPYGFVTKPREFCHTAPHRCDPLARHSVLVAVEAVQEPRLSAGSLMPSRPSSMRPAA